MDIFDIARAGAILCGILLTGVVVRSMWIYHPPAYRNLQFLIISVIFFALSTDTKLVVNSNTEGFKLELAELKQQLATQSRLIQVQTELSSLALVSLVRCPDKDSEKKWMFPEMIDCEDNPKPNEKILDAAFEKSLGLQVLDLSSAYAALQFEQGVGNPIPNAKTHFVETIKLLGKRRALLEEQKSLLNDLEKFNTSSAN